jgi:uncharacterized membrane protein YvbJ
MKTCQNCGKEETGDFKFCSDCNTRYVSASSDSTNSTNSLWGRATAGSGYLKYVWGWALTQIVIGALGLAYTTFRMNSDDLYSDEKLAELQWQTLYAEVFSWGLALLLTALSLSAIRDFLRRN